MTEQYIGNELEIFEKAFNWKAYYAGFIKPYLKGTIMEVGAGIGATTRCLITPESEKWICLEPDERLAQNIKHMQGNELPPNVELRIGTLRHQSPDEKYDAIIYIDVIEHIEHDAEEVSLAVSHLKPGGHLIILVPAHQMLFSAFDKAIGHFRRYDKRMLLNVIPLGLKPVRVSYLDSIGLFASLANKYFLRQSYPTLKQVLFWDKNIIPLSRIMDPVLSFSTGKSLLGIWQKD